MHAGKQAARRLHAQQARHPASTSPQACPNALNVHGPRPGAALQAAWQKFLVSISQPRVCDVASKMLPLELGPCSSIIHWRQC